MTAQWVSESAAPQPGFMGAFYRGSINEADDESDFPYSSDIDLTLVFEGDPPDDPPRSVERSGWRFGGGCWSLQQLLPLEAVLCDYRIGYAFRDPNILPGASQRLAQMAATAAVEFPKRHWVNRRIEDALANCTKYIGSISKQETPFHRVLIWLWAAGITTHIVLAAGLRNPTVRKRYQLAREVLSDFGCLDLYGELLDLQGSRGLERNQVQGHLDIVTEVFDAACEVGNLESRVKAIDGSQELIDQGYHREAVFWLVASYARCMVTFHDAGSSAHLDRFRPGFDRLIGDLGISSPDDVFERAKGIRALLPRITAVALSIAETHPDVVDLDPAPDLDKNVTGGVLLR